MKKPIDMVVVALFIGFLVIIISLPDKRQPDVLAPLLPNYQPPAHITCYSGDKKILEQDVIRWRIENLSLYLDNGDRYFNVPCVISSPKVIVPVADLSTPKVVKRPYPTSSNVLPSPIPVSSEVE